MPRLGIVFPGQGAQQPGMGRALWERSSVVRAGFAEASAGLGWDLAELCFSGSEEALRQTDAAQPALYVVGYLAWRAFAVALGDCAPVVAAAGHSLGEYTALAAAGALSFTEGLRLVATRGRLMRQASDRSPGAMAAILGLDAPAVAAACAAARDAGVVVVANDNAPGQVVISGMPAAVAAAGMRARERGARRVVPLAVGGAFHSPLMAEVADELTAAIRAAPLGPAAWPIVGNASAALLTEPAELRAELEQQLCAPVRWVESVQQLTRLGVTAVVEFGPTPVLAGMIRRIEPSLAVFSVGDDSQLDTALAALGSRPG
jgi:[acyl-carrier-protein] S-malonyltransferase